MRALPTQKHKPIDTDYAKEVVEKTLTAISASRRLLSNDQPL